MMSLNAIFLTKFLKLRVCVLCAIIRPQVPDLSACLVLHLNLPHLELLLFHKLHPGLARKIINEGHKIVRITQG